MNVRLSKDQKIKVLNADDLYSIMQRILMRENKIRRNQEHFWVVGLDNQNKVLSFVRSIVATLLNRSLVIFRTPDVKKKRSYFFGSQNTPNPCYLQVFL